MRMRFVKTEKALSGRNNLADSIVILTSLKRRSGPWGGLVEGEVKALVYAVGGK